MILHDKLTVSGNGFRAKVEQVIFKGGMSEVMLVSEFGVKLYALVGDRAPTESQCVWCELRPADMTVLGEDL